MTVTEKAADRALRTALSRGGEWAELFWERHTVVTLTLDDDKLEDAITGVDQGAGIRVTSGDRGVYANGNVNDGDDLLAIAGRAAAAIGEEGIHEVTALSADVLPRPSTVEIDPRTVPIERKVELMKLANREARAFDPRVHQVTVLYRESVQDVVVANSEGRFRKDTRTRLVFGVLVTAKNGDVLESGYKAKAGTEGFEMLSEEAVLERGRRHAHP